MCKDDLRKQIRHKHLHNRYSKKPTFELKQRSKVRIQVQGCIPLWKDILKGHLKKKKDMNMNESNMNVQFDPWSLCCSSNLTPAAAVLQLGALALSFSCAGEIILPQSCTAKRVICLRHLHHSRMGSRVRGNGRRRTKRRVSPEPVYMLLRRLSACAHTTRPFTGAASRMRHQHQVSRYDCAAALFPRIKVKLK